MIWIKEHTVNKIPIIVSVSKFEIMYCAYSRFLVCFVAKEFSRNDLEALQKGLPTGVGIRSYAKRLIDITN